MVNVTSKSYANMIFYDDKKGKTLFTQLIRCRTRKCAKTTKDYVEHNKLIENKFDELCPDNNFDCIKKVDKKYGPKPRRLYKKLVKCGEKECSKETRSFRKYKKTLRSNRHKN
jgi:hypothetical protein